MAPVRLMGAMGCLELYPGKTLVSYISR